MRLILATRNAHKAGEIRALLRGKFEVVTMDEAGVGIDIAETGGTLGENAVIKAQALFNRLGGRQGDIVVADDSGLEVEALGGAPGVRSARYAGAHGDDEANNRKLIDEMRLHNNRRARFVAVIAVADSSGVSTFEGEVRGTIAHEPRGDQGFGYDPLFIPTGYRSTFAELGSDVKSRISHRAGALRKLAAFLGKLG